MDLRERLGGYEVTAVPPRRPALSLVWSVAPTPEEMAPDGTRIVAAPIQDAAAEAGLAILDDYRITRIPGRAAS